MTSYSEAGVDLAGASRHVDKIKDSVTATWSAGVIGDFGGFATGVEIPPEYETPVLMMSTDGVGTKLELARSSDSWDGVGHDLVAMCVDDLAAVGARPLGFVDYMAVGALNADRDAAIVESIAEACLLAGCALLGGETAEHPGVMEHDAVDLAGAVMGVVERGKQLGPHRVIAGDVVIGLRSPNVRSNGFSLIRATLADQLRGHANTLLAPSVIYSPAVLTAVNHGGVHSAAHITGGGLVENLGRAFPKDLGVTINTETWTPPEVFKLIADSGVSDAEMFSTFNMGIGFCLIVEPKSVDPIMKLVQEHQPSILGEVSAGLSVKLA